MWLYRDRAIRSREDGYKLFKQFLGELDREYFVVMCLDVKNQPTAINICHIGSLNASLVHRTRGFYMDPNLVDELKEELPSIFNFSLLGLHDLMNNNYQLVSSKECEDTLKEHFMITFSCSGVKKVPRFYRQY